MGHAYSRKSAHVGVNNLVYFLKHFAKLKPPVCMDRASLQAYFHDIFMDPHFYATPKNRPGHTLTDSMMRLHSELKLCRVPEDVLSWILIEYGSYVSERLTKARQRLSDTQKEVKTIVQEAFQSAHASDSDAKSEEKNMSKLMKELHERLQTVKQSLPDTLS